MFVFLLDFSDIGKYNSIKFNTEQDSGENVKYRNLLFSVLFIFYLAFSLFSMENVSISLRTGKFYDGVMKDSFLFIASGRGVDIYDISIPNEPVIVCTLDTPGICNDIFLKDNLFYIADGPSGVAVYDISNPTNPSLCDTFCSNNIFKEIFVRDSIFAVSTEPNGISIFKYGVSGNILRLSRIPLYFEVKGLYIKDSLLVAGLSNNEGIISYDISDPSNPTFKDSYTNLRVEDIAGKDTLLFVASRNIDVRIFNINDLSSGPISAYPNNSWIFHLSICDPFLFLTGLFDSIYVLDISNPSSPSLIDSAKTLLPVTHPISNGTILYAPEISTGELFEMSGYTQLAVLDSLYPITDGFICSTFAYVVSKGKGLIILDISNPYSPSIISTFDSLKNIEAVYVRDKIAYLSCGEDGLYILDVTNSSNPTIISFYPTPGRLYYTIKRGNILFLADGSDGFQAISIENITNPVLLDSLHFSGTTYDIAIAGTIAFVSLGDKGFGVINIEDPNNLSLIGTFAGDTFSKALATKGDYLFLGTRNNGVKIYDVTDPSNPVYETTYNVSVFVNDVHYENNLLFLACGSSGIKVVEVTNPLLPTEKESWNTPGVASQIGPSKLGIIPVADSYSFRIDSSYRDTIPPSPVSNLTFEAQDSLIILRWTNPGDMDYEGTRLLFRNDRFPADTNDGTVIFDSLREPNSPDSCYHKGLPGDSTHFYYAVYAYDNSNNFSSPALISGISASDTTPPGTVSQIEFNFWSDTIEVLLMTPSDTDFVGVRAMYSTIEIPQSIHDGELFFDEDSLDPNSYISRKLGGVLIDTTYYFTFFSKDSIPNFSEGVSDSCRIPPDTIPPEEVSIDSFIFWSDTIEVHFTTPGDSDFVGVKAMYDLTQPPQNPYDGELFFDDSLPPGTQISGTLGGVILDTTYYFTLFTRDTVPNYSEGVSFTCTTYTDTIPPGTITEFTAISIPCTSSDTIILSWINPPDSDLDSIEIRWSKYNYPISPDSGTHKWGIPGPNPGNTMERKWVSNSFVPGVRCYFSGFSFDRTGNVSPGAHAYCPTPKLTTVSYTHPPEPIKGETATWLDSVEVSFTAPMLVPTLETGVEIKGRQDYSFRIERGNGNRYIFIPPSFSALDTITVTLKQTIKDSIDSPFDGNGNGIPDSTGDFYTWHFYTGLICDYTGNDTITSEDFAIFKDAYESQDITKETGPCEGTIPYYTPTPDSIIDFEDFSIFVMMWNWSLDNRGFSEIGGGSDSLLRIESINNNLIIKTDRCKGLIGGEILLNGTGGSVIVKKGKGLHENDIFLTRFIDKKVLISFGIMSKEIKNKAIANISLPLSMEEIRYAYRLIFSDCKKEGKGIFTINKLLPVKTILKSIYPNPGKEMKLIYGIPEDMKISIDIFDVTGRKTYTLYSGRKKAGYHTITWDGKKDKMRLPAGIYFIRLKTKKDSLVKTLILLR